MPRKYTSSDKVFDRNRKAAEGRKEKAAIERIIDEEERKIIASIAKGKRKYTVSDKAIARNRKNAIGRQETAAIERALDSYEEAIINSIAQKRRRGHQKGVKISPEHAKKLRNGLKEHKVKIQEQETIYAFVEREEKEIWRLGEEMIRAIDNMLYGLQEIIEKDASTKHWTGEKRRQWDSLKQKRSREKAGVVKAKMMEKPEPGVIEGDLESIFKPLKKAGRFFERRL